MGQTSPLLLPQHPQTSNTVKMAERESCDAGRTQQKRQHCWPPGLLRMFRDRVAPSGQSYC